MTAGSDLGCRRSTETKKKKTAGVRLSQPAVVDVKEGAPEEKLSPEVPGTDHRSCLKLVAARRVLEILDREDPGRRRRSRGV